MKPGKQQFSRVLLLSPKAGSMTAQIERKLRQAFPDQGRTPATITAEVGGLKVLLARRPKRPS